MGARGVEEEEPFLSISSSLAHTGVATAVCTNDDALPRSMQISARLLIAD